MTTRMRNRTARTVAALAVASTLAVGVTPAKAADDKPAPAPTFLQSIQVTGFVDTYYSWNFNQSSPEALRNFDVTHNSFSLNYAEIAVTKLPTEQSRAGFRLDFGAGDTATLVNAYEPGGTDFLKHVQQAYVWVLAPVGKGLTIDVGKFVTPAGAEVIESKDNYNYSRGFLFALAVPVLPRRCAGRLHRQRQDEPDRLSRQRLERRAGQQQGQERDRLADLEAERQDDGHRQLHRRQRAGRRRGGWRRAEPDSTSWPPTRRATK